MLYNSNGGFTWNDLYTMPTKLRQFYWKKLLEQKEKESEILNKVPTSKNPSSKVRRK